MMKIDKQNNISGRELVYMGIVDVDIIHIEIHRIHYEIKSFYKHIYICTTTLSTLGPRSVLMYNEI